MSSIVLIRFLYRYSFDCHSKCLHMKLMLHFTECYDFESKPKKNFESHCICKVFMWIYLCNICEQWVPSCSFARYTLYTNIRHIPCRIRESTYSLNSHSFDDTQNKAEKKKNDEQIPGFCSKADERFSEFYGNGVLPSTYTSVFSYVKHFCSLYIVFGCCYLECIICLCCATFGHQTQSMVFYIIKYTSPKRTLLLVQHNFNFRNGRNIFLFHWNYF